MGSLLQCPRQPLAVLPNRRTWQQPGSCSAQQPEPKAATPCYRGALLAGNQGWPEPKPSPGSEVTAPRETASENPICLFSYSLCSGDCFEISCAATWVFDSHFGSLVNTAFSVLLCAQLLAQPSWKTKVAPLLWEVQARVPWDQSSPGSSSGAIILSFTY